MAPLNDILFLHVATARAFDIPVSQLLLSRPDFLHRAHFLVLQGLLRQMCDAGITPVINENDAVAADTDWSFGDNDSLAAILAVSIGARELLLVVSATFAGASRLAEPDGHPALLRAQVTSKGGATEAAIRVFADHDIQSVWQAAVQAAYHRAKELGK